MYFNCGKCGDTQALSTILPVGVYPQKPHNDWGVTCQSCGFFGKSKIFLQAWKQSQRETTQSGSAFTGFKSMSLERIETLVKQTGMMVSRKLEMTLRD